MPGVSLTPNSVDVRNGVGTALITVGGGAGGSPLTLLPTGSTWKFLDDGSDQGTAWRAPSFDDGAWAAAQRSSAMAMGMKTRRSGFVGPNNNKNATTYFRTVLSRSLMRV